MDVIFALGKTFVSKVIAAIDDTDVSHVALSSAKVAGNTLVFHSVTSGVKISTRHGFKQKYDVKRIYRLGSSYENEEDLLWSLLSNNEDKPYDFLAGGYLALYLIMRKMGIKLPDKNIWQNRNHFICTEFASAGIMGEVNSMVSLRTLEKYILETSVHEQVKFF
jgi:hypothetical protein